MFQGGPGHGGQQQQGGHGGGGVSGQYSYNNWSPPAQSNESVNGYFLERSHSARQTLERACELLPDEEVSEISMCASVFGITSPCGGVEVVFERVAPPQ